MLLHSTVKYLHIPFNNSLIPNPTSQFRLRRPWIGRVFRRCWHYVYGETAPLKKLTFPNAHTHVVNNKVIGKLHHRNLRFPTLRIPFLATIFIFANLVFASTIEQISALQFKSKYYSKMPTSMESNIAEATGRTNRLKLRWLSSAANFSK